MKIFRLFVFTFFIAHLSFSYCYSQAGSWTWVRGDNTLNASGNFGTLGVSSPNNIPPPRYACGNWVDTGGNFWVYSGVNAFDDLWRFDPVTTEWTCMFGGNSGYDHKFIHQPPTKGLYDPSNDPGVLNWGMLTWTTRDNHLWLFGGLYGDGSYGPGSMNNNLWQYNPAINQWAWMGNFGPTNYGTMGIGDSTTMPGGRQEGNCAWVDKNGNLWLFGGCNYAYLSYNDLWEYDVQTGIWTWQSGSAGLEDSVGSYGTVGVPWNQNFPSARSTNFFWTDTAGNFWIGGGTDHFLDYMYQDVWELNPYNLNWTWVTGIDGPDNTSPIGENCKSDPLNVPGRRYENRATWKHCEDLIITYDGFQDWKDSTYAGNNDMWGYKISSNEWTKINQWPAGGNYGVKGVSSVNNAPPARIGGVGFTGKDNSLWLFGGQNNQGFFDDLWQYVIDTNCISCKRSCTITPPVITSNKPIFCSNDSARICVNTSITGYSNYQWNVGDSAQCVYATQAGNYYVTVTAANGCTAESNHISESVYPVPAVAVTVHNDTLSSFGSIGYHWLFNGDTIPGATGSQYVAKKQGEYSLAATDSNGCVNISLEIPVTVGVNTLAEERVSLYPNPSKGSWQLIVGTGLIGGKLEVFDDEGRSVYQSVILNPKSELNLNVSSGIYWLRIYSASATIVRKLVRL